MKKISKSKNPLPLAKKTKQNKKTWWKFKEIVFCPQMSVFRGQGYI